MNVLLVKMHNFQPIKSRTTSDAIISPAADGTNAVEPGTAFFLPASPG
jgi:hypothetical protein